MTVLSTPVIPIERFTYSPSSGMLTAEASDLGSFLGRVYDDACDVGFTVVGRGSVVFATHHEQRDREGELLYTDYRPIPEQTDTPDITVRVFND